MGNRMGMLKDGNTGKDREERRSAWERLKIRVY